VATRGHWQLLTCRGTRYGAGVLACATAAAITGIGPAGATAGRPAQHGSAHPAATTRAAATRLVSSVPAHGTPQLATTGTTEQVRQLVQCGGTMYAVGTFTKIEWNGKTYSRNNIFSFRATAPFTVKGWNPDVNGKVDTIAFKRGDCADAYIGGAFSSVHGRPVKDIAKISTTTGAVVSRFGNHANGEVFTLLATPNQHLLAGGGFTAINGRSADKRYASLNLSTGKDDGYLNLHISGHYVYPGGAPNQTSVYNQQLSPGGSEVLAEGVFTSVGGKARQQIFMLSLSHGHGSVTGWAPKGFTQHCFDKHPFYVKAAAWSPSGRTVYVADTGRHLLDWKGGYPLTGLCDVAAAFPASHGKVSHTWVQYTGCWSLFSIAASSSAVYVGGHEKYGDNRNGCKFRGPGAIPAPGLGGLKPGNGSLLRNASGTAGRYSRSRGLGADDALLTKAGLWVASDNYAGSNSCGGIGNHAGICFLPYP
jgi:WD40 repeat protein